MIITGKNYIESATLASTSALDDTQDVNNLKIPQLSKDFKMTTSGVVDITGVATVPVLIVDKGNCTSVTATISYSSSSDRVFDLTATETCFYYFLDKVSAESDITKISLLFIGPLSGTDLYPSVGYIFIGDYLQLPAINQNSVLYYQTTTQKTSSISGQQYTDKGYQTVATTFDFPRVPDSTESYLGVVVAGRKQILATWRDTELQYEWLFPWEQSLDDVPPIFGSVEGDGLSFDRVSGEGKYWHMALSFREVK